MKVIEIRLACEDSDVVNYRDELIDSYTVQSIPHTLCMEIRDPTNEELEEIERQIADRDGV